LENSFANCELQNSSNQTKAFDNTEMYAHDIEVAGRPEMPGIAKCLPIYLKSRVTVQPSAQRIISSGRVILSFTPKCFPCRSQGVRAVSLPRRESYSPPPADRRDQVIYFMLVDRFSDGQEFTPPLLISHRLHIALRRNSRSRTTAGRRPPASSFNAARI
jgi:hypothetical protein